MEHIEISKRVAANQIREKEFQFRTQYQRLMLAQTDSERAAITNTFDVQTAEKILSALDTAPGDNPKARDIIYEKFPELKTW